MLTQEITYTDYNGEKQTEKFYFHLSVNEMTELQLSKDEGFDEYLSSLIKTENTRELFKTIKMLITMSYGEKDETGKHFRKSEEKTADFINSPAFDAMLLDMLTNTEYAYKFVNGIIPSAEKLGLTPEAIEAKVAELKGETTSE